MPKIVIEIDPDGLPDLLVASIKTDIMSVVGEVTDTIRTETGAKISVVEEE